MGTFYQRRYLRFSFLVLVPLLLSSACRSSATPVPLEPVYPYPEATHLALTPTIGAPTAVAEMYPPPTTVTATQPPQPTMSPQVTSTIVPTALPTVTPAPLAGDITYVISEISGEMFSQDSPKVVHIHSLNVVSGETKQLTHGNFRDLQPVWSPDGSRIAFVSDRDGNFELYLMSSDGLDVTRLTNSIEDELNPAWSPDGTQLAFDRTSDPPTGEQERHLYAITLADMAVRQLTNGPDNDSHPSWSPDGNYLAFNRDVVHLEEAQPYYEPHIYALDLANGIELPLTKARFDEVPFPTADGWTQVWLQDPLWVPDSGHGKLSLTQLPARCGEGGAVAIFSLDWTAVPPTLIKVVEVEGGTNGYAWGAGGSWITSSEYNGWDADVPSGQLDVAARRVDTQLGDRQPERRPANPVEQSAPCVGFEEVTWLTKSSAFEIAPNWSP